MPEKAAFFHFFQPFLAIYCEISGLAISSKYPHFGYFLDRIREVLVPLSSVAYNLSD